MNEAVKYKIPDDSKLFVVIKKKSMEKNELKYNEKDCVRIINPKAILHKYEPQNDGTIRKIKEHEFTFDNIFNEKDDNMKVYKYTLSP